jgi:hypothetical protein
MIIGYVFGSKYFKVLENISSLWAHCMKISNTHDKLFLMFKDEKMRYKNV